MLAKVIVWALTWDDVIARGERALRDMGVDGIRTTIPYYLEILRHPEFRRGVFNTGFVEAHPELTDYSCKRRKDELAAAVAAAIAAHAGL
jgi:pyruvate carboxylase subunit A